MVGASWSPEMMAMCLMPRSRRPWMMLAGLGPDCGLQLERAAQLVVDGDHHQRVAFAVRLVERRLDLSRQRHALPCFMKRRCRRGPMTCTSMPTVMP